MTAENEFGKTIGGRCSMDKTAPADLLETDMVEIECAIRCQDGSQGLRIVEAMALGLTEQCKATPWTIKASLTDKHGRDAGFIKRVNEGRKL